MNIDDMDMEQYRRYAVSRRKKSKLAGIYDKAMTIENRNKYGGLNGGVTSDAFGNPYLYECTVGNGYTDKEGKTWFTSNVYRILFYSGNKGATIYKSSERSINNKCYTCGGSPEVFGEDFFSPGCRVYEDLELEEILSMLVNKDIIRFSNVNKDNPYNMQFLSQMQKRLIKSLEYNRQIHWSKQQKKYVSYEFYKAYEKCVDKQRTKV